MRYSNIDFPKSLKRLSLIYFLIVFMSSCNHRYDKQFYGTYENIDTNRFVFSGVTFYENNTYSFYYSTCFDGTRDSGSFSLTNNVISFRSFNLPLLDTNVHHGKNLDKEKFLYEFGKILYVRRLAPPLKPAYFDTLLIGKKKL